MLKIKAFEFNPFYEKTYVVFDYITKEALIIDAGCSNDKENETLFNFINSETLTLKYIINTHCHIDHIIGNYAVKTAFPEAKVLYSKQDEFLIPKMKEQALLYNMTDLQTVTVDEYLSEDLKLKLGSYEIDLIFTPGHSPGEYCVYFKSENILFSGDVLFKDSVGRTDLWAGNTEILVNSILEKLFKLPHKTKVFPGHGSDTTIGYEFKYNPFLNQYL